jgi:inositol oxygenase
VYAQCTDLSDPDMSISNKHHAFQVAEAIRAADRPEWEQLIGLLHDIGKYIHIDGVKEDGTTLDTQWSIVGDTYILGIPLPDNTVPFSLLKSRYEGSPGVDENGCCYWRGCGLMNTLTTFGHDEVLYRWLLRNSNTLPTAAYYIARYHSLYPWHSGGAYTELENDDDRLYKTDVQRFQSYDLYTKTDTEIDMKSLKPYYDRLIHKFFRRPDQLYW